jgi:hypothetical protein
MEMLYMVDEREVEYMRYEECVKDYKELLDDLTLIKQGKDLSRDDFVNRCDDLIIKFKTINKLGIYEEQARALAINDLSAFISEVQNLKLEDN